MGGGFGGGNVGQLHLRHRSRADRRAAWRRPVAPLMPRRTRIDSSRIVGALHVTWCLCAGSPGVAFRQRQESRLWPVCTACCRLFTHVRIHMWAFVE